jgi:CTP:molybdopterin cytidylyltransferase MocA
MYARTEPKSTSRSVCESGRVSRAAVRILHPRPAEDAGELTRLLAQARAIASDDLVARFRAVGADDVEIVGGPPDSRSFGERLRAVAATLPAGDGLVVLGSGSIPLASEDHLTRLLEVARSGGRQALTNNRFSSDVVAIGDASTLAALPDLASDNGLPRWLEFEAGMSVDELPDGDRLGLDLDSPADLELVRRHADCPKPLVELATEAAPRLERFGGALDGLTALARNPRAELLVAGRLSAAGLRRLEEAAACRIRALVEERGLRTASPGQRPAASALGMLLDRDGAAAIGTVVARLADGAVIDSRVQLAHRLGADEAAWPSPEDRYASDLLFADRVRDPWLQQLTLHAWSHEAPIALGGHTLVGPGLGLALGLEA